VDVSTALHSKRASDCNATQLAHLAGLAAPDAHSAILRPCVQLCTTQQTPSVTSLPGSQSRMPECGTGHQMSASSGEQPDATLCPKPFLWLHLVAGAVQHCRRDLRLVALQRLEELNVLWVVELPGGAAPPSPPSRRACTSRQARRLLGTMRLVDGGRPGWHRLDRGHRLAAVEPQQHPFTPQQLRSTRSSCGH